MSFVVNFYSFTKKENSTKRPTGAASAVYNCIIKNGSGVLNPKIELTLAGNGNPTSYNYAYIQDFARYYFVHEWEYSDRKWIAHMSVDVLATYKDIIGSANLYVLRSASANDPAVVETMYPAKIGATYVQSTNGAWDVNWIMNNPSAGVGQCIVGMVNGDTNYAAGVTYFCMSGSKISQLKQYMLSTIEDWNNITTFTGDIAKAFMDPMQYMVSCVWFPFYVTSAGAIIDVKFGFWNSHISARSLDTFTRTFSKTIPRPARPDIANYAGNWVNIEPFAEYFLLAYPFGRIPISGNDIDATGVTLDMEVDLITGLAQLEVRAAGSNVVHDRVLWTGAAQLGVPIQLSQISTDYLGAVSGVVAGAAGLASGLGIFSEILSGASIGSSIANAMPKVEQKGYMGGFGGAIWAGTPSLNAIFRTPVEENVTENGRPLCQNRVINTLTGYIKCMEGDVPTGGTAEEDRQIKDFLESGFYYE